MVDDVLHSDESICLNHALKAGAIGDGEQSHLDIVVEASRLGMTEFYFWVSSEYEKDTLDIFVDSKNDGTIDGQAAQISGVPLIHFDVHYPANLPETCWDG